MKGMMKMSSSKVLECLHNINAEATEARQCVLESYINLDKKFSLMEQNGVDIASGDPVIQSLLDNRSSLVPEYIDETAKGRAKLNAITFGTAITGATTLSLLTAKTALIVALAVTPGAGTAITFGASFIGTVLGAIAGVKLSDWSRRKGARQEFVKDAGEVVHAMLLIIPKEDGSFVVDKNARKKMFSMGETIDMMNRQKNKLQPPMSRDEKDAYSDLTTSMFAMNQKPNKQTAEKFMSDLNKAIEICMKADGVDVNSIEKEARKALKEAATKDMKEGKSDET